MKRYHALHIFAFIVGVAWSGLALAQDPAAYTTRAGMIAIGNDPECSDAELFHVAYTPDGADPATRPVTFLVNGGPGGASIFLLSSCTSPP